MWVIANEVERIGFDGAQDIVCPFAAKIFERTLARPAVHSGDLAQTFPPLLYSKSNLTTSVAETFAAYRVYYVLSPSEAAAEEALTTMYICLASLVPDDYAEPLNPEDFNALSARKTLIWEQLANDEPTLRVVRGVIQTPLAG
jgi:hypothetical protein